MLSVRASIGTDRLAGIAAGKAALPKLLDALPPATGLLLVDLSGVELVTASAFREAFIPLAQQAAEQGRGCLFVNAEPLVKEEAAVVADQMGRVVVFATYDPHGIRDAVAIGPLDDKLAATFRIVLELGEADAKRVKDQSGEDTVTTAWNNRLVALHRMGLVAVRQAGKTKYYTPIVERLSYGPGLHP